MSAAVLPAPLAIAGEMTIYRAGELRAVLQDALARPGDLVLDLGDVTECDTAGVQLLLAAARVAEGRGDSLRLAAASPSARDVLDTLGLATRFGAGGEDA